MGLGKEDHRGKVPLSLNYIKGLYTVDTDLDCLAEAVSAGFSHCKVILFLLFHSVLFGGMPPSTAHT